MAKVIPYVAVAQASIGANQQAQLIYTVPQSWVIHIHSWYWESDGIFQLNQVQDNSGLGYTNATQNAPIYSKFLQDPQTAFLSLRDFIVPIDLDGGKIFQALVQDLSSSTNLVKMLLNCTVDYPGN